MKKVFSFIMCIVLIFSVVPSFGYTAEEEYKKLAAEYPEFVSELEGQGISEEILVSFLEDVCDYLVDMNSENPITEDNFEKCAIKAISHVVVRTDYKDLQKGLLALYPNEIKEVMLKGIVPDKFKPMVEALKSMIFEILASEESKVIAGYATIIETVLKGSSYTLPSKVVCVTESGGKVNVDVSWASEVSTATVGTFTVYGTVTIPEGYTLGANITNGITYIVSVVESLNERFTDITPSHWAYEAICTLADNFIISGYLDNTFKPDINITRGEFAKIIVSATDCFDHAAQCSFSDVSSDDWYYGYVASALKAGLFSGYPDGSFRPNDNITRSDICAVVYRSVKDRLRENGVGELFEDDGDIASYAKEAVYALNANGIISGMGNKKFLPNAAATRAQTARIIYAAYFVN